MDKITAAAQRLALEDRVDALRDTALRIAEQTGAHVLATVSTSGEAERVATYATAVRALVEICTCDPFGDGK